MNKIIFYSNNNDKIKEINSLFKKLSIKVFCPKDFGITLEPKEVGSSFAENAKIKSLYGFQNIQIPCFADDSGICIEALNWGPNINSKKFIKSFKNNFECFKYILKEVEKTGKNKAYFQTSICYTIKTNYHIVFDGLIEGKISKKIIGNNGFGYDPIFIPKENKKTFAQLTRIEKNSLSHRSVAIRKLINFLSN